MAQPMRMLGAMWIRSWRRMPSRSGQNGITCMRPTAPLGETAQRSKRLSTSMSAITRPGGRRASPARCGAVDLPEDVEPLVLFLHDAPQPRLHQRVPHRRVVMIGEALRLTDGLRDHLPQLSIELLIRV